MRRIPVRFWLVSAFLLAGMAFFCPADAADATDDEFKALVDQDAKAITMAASKSGKTKASEKNSSSAIKSNALIMASYANARIDGKNAGSDANAAAVRDLAIKLFQAAEKKDFKAVAALVTELANPKPAATAKKIDVLKTLNDYLKGLGEDKQLSQKDVMDNFKSTDKFGTNGEADIKANGTKKKAPAKPAEANLIALRVLTMAELNKTITKTENAAAKKEWDEYNQTMIKAANDLQAAAAKKTSPADMAKIFTRLDGSCTACHDQFK